MSVEEYFKGMGVVHSDDCKVCSMPVGHSQPPRRHFVGKFIVMLLGVLLGCVIASILLYKLSYWAVR